MTTRIGCLLALVGLGLVGCAGAEFERSATAQPRKRLSAYEEVRVADKAEDLPQPTEVLGTLKLGKRSEAGEKSAAEKTLKGQAAMRGCNAIVGVEVQRIDSVATIRHKVILPGGASKIEEKTEPRVEYQWSCQCVYAGATAAPATVTGAPATVTGAPATVTGAPATASGAPATASGAPATASGAPATPAAAPVAAEKAKTAKGKGQEKKAEPTHVAAEPAPAVAAPPAPAPAPIPAPDPAPAPAPPAPAVETPAAPAPEAKSSPAAAAAATATAKREGVLAAWDNAIRDGSAAALLDFLAKNPDAPEIHGVQEALVQVVGQHLTEWVVADTVKVSTAEVEGGPDLPQDKLQEELANAGATSSRSWMPKTYSYRVALRNPTKVPVLLEVQLPGGRIVRLLGPGRAWTTTQTAPCTPQPQPASRAKDGLVLDLHFACAAEPAAIVTAIWPAKREAAVDKKSVDGDVSFDVMARIWREVPDTALTPAYVAMVDETMAKRAEDIASVKAKLNLQKKPAPDVATPVGVAVRNTAQREVTVVFDIGAGREEHLAVPRAGNAELKLEAPVGVTPELHVRGVLPRLRSTEWLVGNWSFGVARFVILPVGKNAYGAFVLEAPANPGAPWHVTAVALQVGDGTVTAAAKLPATFVKALFAAQTPTTCETSCDVTWSIRLSDLERYVLGAGRVLPMEVMAGESHGRFEFAADH